MRSFSLLVFGILLAGTSWAGNTPGHDLFSAKRRVPRRMRADTTGIAFQHKDRSVQQLADRTIQHKVKLVTKPGNASSEVHKPYFEVYKDRKTGNPVVRILTKATVSQYLLRDDGVLYKDGRGQVQLGYESSLPKGARDVVRLKDKRVTFQLVTETRVEAKSPELQRKAQWLARLSKTMKRGKRGMPLMVQEHLLGLKQRFVNEVARQRGDGERAGWHYTDFGGTKDLLKDFRTTQDQYALKAWAKGNAEVKALLKTAKKEHKVGRKRAKQVALVSGPVAAGLIPVAFGYLLGNDVATQMIRSGGPGAPFGPLTSTVFTMGGGLIGSGLARGGIVLTANPLESATEQLKAAQQGALRTTVQRARAKGLAIPEELAHMR